MARCGAVSNGRATVTDLLTTKEVQDLLKVDRTTIYRMLKDGRLQGVKVGQQWRFPLSEIEGLLAGTHVHQEEIPLMPVSPLPLHCVAPIQRVFAEIAGVGAVTTAPDGQPLTEISNSCAFCDLMLASPSGRQACIASWRRLGRVARPPSPIRHLPCRPEATLAAVSRSTANSPP